MKTGTHETCRSAIKETMDFSFSEEQERFRNSVRDFCERTIAPRVDEIDGNGEIPVRL